jgi:hypothetical protein
MERWVEHFDRLLNRATCHTRDRVPAPGQIKVFAAAKGVSTRSLPCAEFQQPTTACFIEFRAAFDSVDRNSLWAILQTDGVPRKLVNLLNSYYLCTRACIRVYDAESTEFPLNSGVRQGCLP